MGDFMALCIGLFPWSWNNNARLFSVHGSKYVRMFLPRQLTSNQTPPANGEQWWHAWFLWPEQPLTQQEHTQWLNAAQATAIAEQYGRGPFTNTVGRIAQQNSKYTGTLEASQHQAASSDTVLLGHTSPKLSTGPPASRLVTHITDLDSEMESSVDPSVCLPVAHFHCWPSMTSTSMSLTIIHPDEPIACIDDKLLYDNRYAKTLPYGDDTPMDDTLSS